MILEHVDTVVSTSDVLKRRAETEPGEHALLARHQTGGRGRHGRQWQSVDGNLFLSVLLRPGPIPFPGHWSLLAGVAVAQALAEHLPEASAPRLKWPNDVLLGDAKLAGILAEIGDADGPYLVLGIGINLAAAPASLDRPTTCLAAHARAPSPAAFAPHLLAILQTWRDRYTADGFPPIRTAWLAHTTPIGSLLTIRLGPDHVTGAFTGLAPDGALTLDTPTGPRTLVSGELA